MVRALLSCTDTLCKASRRSNRQNAVSHPRMMPSQPDATWITCRADLAAWFDAVAPGDVVGLDTEFTRRSTFHPQLSLLQLAHRGRHALVDPLAFDLADTLQASLAERPITCVMHSAGEDLETLAPWLPHGPATLFDTQTAAAFAGLGQGCGYRALVLDLCSVELDKGETRSDWNRRPLSAAQTRYATLDVVYLEPLHDALVDRVRGHGHMDWFKADCERLKHRAESDPVPEQPQLELHAAAGWPAVRQAQLRQLLQWRERAARSWDKPRNWLIDNHQALALAHDPPASMDQLMQVTRGQRALRGALRRELFDVLQRAPDAAEVAATLPITGRPDHKSREVVQAMKQRIDRLAHEHDLPPGLLCPRKPLEAYVATRQWPDMLQGWRRELLQPHLQPLLPD